jgi:hypothetical protein
MLHFIQETWHSIDQIDDFMLTALSINLSVEQSLRSGGKEPCHWLNWIIDGHNIIIFNYFNITSILLKELIHGIALPLISQTSYSWKSHR